jgi:hypothetical protein
MLPFFRAALFAVAFPSLFTINVSNVLVNVLLTCARVSESIGLVFNYLCDFDPFN